MGVVYCSIIVIFQFFKGRYVIYQNNVHKEITD